MGHVAGDASADELDFTFVAALVRVTHDAKGAGTELRAAGGFG